MRLCALLEPSEASIRVDIKEASQYKPTIPGRDVAEGAAAGEDCGARGVPQG